MDACSANPNRSDFVQTVERRTSSTSLFATTPMLFACAIDYIGSLMARLFLVKGRLEVPACVRHRPVIGLFCFKRLSLELSCSVRQIRKRNIRILEGLH